jgi:anti-sigma B factor antagonist
MEIGLRESGNSTVVDLNGDITLRTTPQVRKVLLGLFRDKHAQRVVVNMNAVRYIDSAGVASLVEALRVSRDLKSGFALFGLSKAARQVLELTRLTRVFEIHQNEQEALQADAATGS